MSDIRGKYFPVGKGLTYGFKIDDFHILFDIARFSKNCSLLYDLEYFYENRNLDILSISHFDDDHMGGIKDLIDYGFKFKKVIIPYFESDELSIVNLSYIFSKINSMKKKNRHLNIDEYILELLERYMFNEFSEVSFFEKDLKDLLANEDIDAEIVRAKDSLTETYSIEKGNEKIEFWKLHYMNSKCSNSHKINKFKKEMEQIGICNQWDLIVSLKSSVLYC